MTFANQLGTRIKIIRANKELTQESLALSAGLKSKGYLSRIERGERLPSLGVSLRLARALDVPLSELFVGVK